jgi:hypothetical protein
MPTLDDGPAHARRSDPATSHDAAASVRVRQSQRAVLRMFLAYGPMTDTELVVRTAEIMSASGARTRRSELVDKGFVEDSGPRVKLPTGRLAIVWKVID